MPNKKLLCLDAGHFHPTETIADKISSVLLFLDEILLHVSRGIRWDSDHVVILNDDLRAIAEEIVRGGLPRPRPHRPGLLRRQHQPRGGLGDRHARDAQGPAAGPAGADDAAARSWRATATSPSRLALLEELKTLPLGAVWDYYCLKQGVPVGMAWLDGVKQYEPTSWPEALTQSATSVDRRRTQA